MSTCTFDEYIKTQRKILHVDQFLFYLRKSFHDGAISHHMDSNTNIRNIFPCLLNIVRYTIIKVLFKSRISTFLEKVSLQEQRISYHAILWFEKKFSKLDT
jgi:hypothetical protein